MFITCVDCGEVFKKSHQRGRCPKRCSRCKTKSRHALKRQRPQGKHVLTCQRCCVSFTCARKKQKYCSASCSSNAMRKSAFAICANNRCGKQFETKPGKLANGRRFCSRECSYHEPLTCQNPACGRQFRMKHRTKSQWRNKGKYCSPQCYRKHRWGEHKPRTSRKKWVARTAYGSLRKRCKSYGVNFDPACTREAVLNRDGWVCQNCGRLCNKEYVLDPITRTPSLRNAEHDHVWPLSARNSLGNVFENSQCLCRKCNMAKGDTIEGQLRLCLEEEAWGNGVRVRSQRSLKSCEETLAAVP